MTNDISVNVTYSSAAKARKTRQRRLDVRSATLVAIHHASGLSLTASVPPGNYTKRVFSQRVDSEREELVRRLMELATKQPKKRKR